MDFEELLAEFRALGGTAENVRLGKGAFGRGIFVIDPSRPATLHCPEHLLVRTDWLELRDGELIAKGDAPLGPRERAFFDACMKHFGWGPTARDEIWQGQERWSRLPAPVIHAICALGVSQDLDLRFLAPTVDVCALIYVRTRRVTYKDGSYIMPIVDLVNHAGLATSYVTSGGVGVEGRFEDEMLVRYTIGDVWNMLIGYGFNNRPPLAHSIAITLDADGKRIVISRNAYDSEQRGDVRFPKIKVEGDRIDLPYLTLGHSSAPDVPRAVFRSLMRPYLAIARADEIFDNITHFNRTKFLELLRTLRGYDGPIVDMLAEATLVQLETLSCCIGARSL